MRGVPHVQRGLPEMRRNPGLGELQEAFRRAFGSIPPVPELPTAPLEPGQHYVRQPNGIWLLPVCVEFEWGTNNSWYGKSIMSMFADFEHTDKPAPREYSDQEIVGWRSWRLMGEINEEPELWSVHNDTKWLASTLRAHERPAQENNSGIYAHADREKAREMAFAEPWPQAYGEVALSGIVVEGARGYRGEQAVIRSLYLIRGTDERSPLDLADALSRRYDVDVALDIDGENMPEPEADGDDED